jgi:hypothetical protein
MMNTQPRKKIIRLIRWIGSMMLAMSACFLTLAVAMRQARHDCIIQIRKDGGVVHTRSELPVSLKNNLHDAYPTWLETPYAVWLPASYHDGHLTVLDHFDDLSTISIEGTAITDLGITYLSRFKKLRLLTLNKHVSKEAEKQIRADHPQLVTVR